jgi:hypothetical protein
MATKSFQPGDTISIQYAPEWQWVPSREAAALNVVGASASASRPTVDTTGAIYFNQSTGDDGDPGTLAEPKQTFAAAAAAAGSGGVVMQLDTGALSVSGLVDVTIVAAIGGTPVIAASDQYTNTDDTATAIVTTYNGAIAGGRSINDNLSVFYGASNKLLVYNSNPGDWQSVTVTGMTGPIRAAAATSELSIVLGTNEAYRIQSGFFSETPALTTQPNYAFEDQINKLFIAVHNSGGIQTRPIAGGAQAWTARALPFVWGDGNVNCGAYGRNLSVVVGDAGRVAYSFDGVNWQMASIPSAVAGTNFTGVCFSGTDFIAVGGTGVVIRSADGVNWQQSGSPTSTVTLTKCLFDGSHYVVVGNSGNVWRSADLSSWTAMAADTGFGTTNVTAVAVAYGFVITAGGTSKVQKAPIGVRTRQSLNGYTSAGHVVFIANTSASEPRRAVANTLHAASIFARSAGTDSVENCDIDNFLFFLDENNATKKVTETIVRRYFAHFFSGSLSLSQFLECEKVTCVGPVYAFSRDNSNNQAFSFKGSILDGGLFSTVLNTSVQDSALRGYASQAVVTGPNAYNIDPLFLDPTAGDYRLGTRADGLPQDSPYLGLSTLFAPNGSAGTGRDLGAYSYDNTARQEFWTKSAILPKPKNGGTFGTRPVAFYVASRNGKPGGVNRPAQWVESIGCAWVDLTQEQFAALMEISKQESVRVRLAWDENMASGTVTVQGSQSQGSPVLVIDEQAIQPGTLVRFGSQSVAVMWTIPGDPTTLVLASPLPVAVTDNDVLTIEGQTGYGEYIIRWTDLSKSRLEYSETLDDSHWSGVQVTFERRRAI